MKPNQFGTLSLDTPRVVGTATAIQTLERLRANPGEECDIVELRLDKLLANTGTPLTPCIDLAGKLEARGVPTLATIRLGKDGGDWTEPETNRLPLFEEAMNHLSCVDIEHDSGIASALVSLAKDLDKPIILSHHDFSGTPSLEELSAIVENAREHPNAIAKIATMVNGEEDLATLRRLVNTYAGVTPLCVIGMGEAGAHTRADFPLLGCNLTYGFLDGSCAPGQLPARELVSRLKNPLSGQTRT